MVKKIVIRMGFLRWHPTWIYAKNQSAIFHPSLKTLSITLEVITLTPKFILLDNKFKCNKSNWNMKLFQTWKLIYLPKVYITIFFIINACDHLVGQESNKNMPNYNVHLSFHQYLTHPTCIPTHKHGKMDYIKWLTI